jgi:hypothetical protein
MAFATRDIDKEEELITTYDRFVIPANLLLKANLVISRYVWVFPKSPIDTDEVIFRKLIPP